MTKLASRMIALAAATMLSGTAIAGSPTVGPTYVGDRSAKDEQETYANLVPAGNAQLLGFVGPARTIGILTGNPEKDTVAFESIIIIPENQPAFGSLGARELQGNGAVFVALDQPAFGAEGARELQDLAIWWMQPAYGAQGARELQSPEFPILAQLTNECS